MWQATPLEAHVRELPRAAVKRRRLLDGNAELALFEAGGDIGMRARIHIRIDAQAHRRHAAQGAGNVVQPLEFGVGFDVEAMNPGRKRCAHLGLGLAHTRKHDLRGFTTGTQHALELAARNNVEAAAQAREQVEHRKVGVGLDGVAHQVVAATERRIEGAETLLDGGARVDVTRRTHRVRQ